MRIGFITYEYPPDIAQGGIATYVAQAAFVLKNRGHDVEIFCGSYSRNISESLNGILVHRCLTASPTDFRKSCVKIFAERHHFKLFDIIESPEIHANAFNIKQKFPNLPLVVKLHMPLFLQMRLYNFYTSYLTKVRFFLGSLRRGKFNLYGNYNFEKDTDYKITLIADGIVSPSISLRLIIEKEWQINKSRIQVIPYPFVPPAQLLNIPIYKKVPPIVSFIGKLNVHKGIINLIKVIRIVAKKHPQVLFQLIGNDSDLPIKKMKMSNFINQQLKDFKSNYIILGGLKYDKVIPVLENSAICIFPSIWENFPLVCLEAMSAGRAIVGSSEGGMDEMLSGGAGIIINPFKVKQMALAILTLLNDDDLRYKYGQSARIKVINNYNSDIIGAQMEAHYLTTIHG